MPRTLSYLKPWVYALFLTYLLVFLHVAIQSLLEHRFVFPVQHLVVLIINLGSQFIIYALAYLPLALLLSWLQRKFVNPLIEQPRWRVALNALVGTLLVILLQWMVVRYRWMEIQPLPGYFVSAYHVFAFVLVQFFRWVRVHNSEVLKAMKRQHAVDWIDS